MYDIVRDVSCTMNELRFKKIILSNGFEMNLTYDHYLLLHDNQWILAKYVQTGMHLKTKDNQMVEIISIEESWGKLYFLKQGRFI